MIKRTSLVYGLALVLCFFAQVSLQVAFPQSVINAMATRYQRYHHYLWHQVREGWNRFPQATKDAYTKIGWKPPHPARTYDSSGRASAILDNYSGEDFLYMHRQMIATVNQIITQNNEPYGKIKGWTTVPAPGDPNWPVPADYSIPGDSGTTHTVNSWKTNSFYTNTIKAAEATFKNPTQLRKMSLQEMGARIEMTIHGYMHMRWSAYNSVGYRNSYKGTIPYMDPKWDTPAYNWLGDMYSSQVNEIFWKLHGWIDDRIQDWMNANGLSSIKWTGTWTGGPMSSLSNLMNKESMTGGDSMDSSGPQSMDILEQAFEIFKQSGVPEVTLTDPVTTGFLPTDSTTTTRKQSRMRRICKPKRTNSL